MTVYIDTFGANFRGMIMCHIPIINQMADKFEPLSEEEQLKTKLPEQLLFER